MKIRDELYKELCRRSYVDYVEYVHKGRWFKSNHLNFVCNKVQEFIERPTTSPYEILIVTMPPQHGKSQSITETLPSWVLGKKPLSRIIEVSYNSTYAEKFGRRNREKIAEYGKDIFNIELSEEKNSNSQFELTNKVGGMISCGILSGITGNPAELIIIDDPIKTKEEADSETIRDKQWGEWETSIKSRCAVGCKVILIMTRWHEDDLAGRLLRNEKRVEMINLPCEAEDNDILGRKKGDALFPEIGKDNNWKDEFKASYTTSEGSRAWLALFQCRPTAEEGNMFKRQWFKIYDELPKVLYKCISVDATFKDGDNNDNVSITVWGKLNSDYYLIDRDNRKMDFPTTLEAITTMLAKHIDTNAIYIEDKANGSAIISVLKSKLSRIVPVEPYGGKVARANAICPLFESGNVYIPNKMWTNNYIEEMVSFPSGVHDDDVDSTSQALNKMRIIDANVKTPEPKQVWNFSIEKPTQSDYGSKIEVV